MSDRQHSKEPWRISQRELPGQPPVCAGAVVCEPGEGANKLGGADDYAAYGGHLIAESVCPADARRIIACVNACTGIETEDIEALVEGGGTLPPPVAVRSPAAGPTTHGAVVLRLGRQG